MPNANAEMKNCPSWVRFEVAHESESAAALIRRTVFAPKIDVAQT